MTVSCSTSMFFGLYVYWCGERMTGTDAEKQKSLAWSREAHSMAQQARVLSGSKLEQLVVRLQRHSGRTKEACWRFVIQHGFKGKTEYRRWTDSELETLREELVRKSVGEVAEKLNRSPKAIRNVLRRNQVSLREIRCDLFSVESLATVLHVRKAEVLSWIERGWLEASIVDRGRRRSYSITPDALQKLYKEHHPDLLKRGLRNLSLFEAYLQYCFSPKHTIGEQLLDVRRDKRERTAFAIATAADVEDADEELSSNEAADHREAEKAAFSGENGGSDAI